MRSAIRTQTDGLGDLYSAQSTIDTSDLPDMARQEFKDEADVNWLLHRFGVGLPQRQLTFGEVDFDIDLQQAHTSMNAAKRAHSRLPQSLRDKYPNYLELLEAINSGELKLDLKAFEESREPPAQPAAAQHHSVEQARDDQGQFTAGD